MTFEQVLQPYSRELFLAEFWRKKPLYLERSIHGFYHSILSSCQIEELLVHGRLRYPDLRLIRNGKKAAADLLITAGWFDKIVPMDARPATLVPLYEAYKDGYTLVLRAERVSPRLAALCRELEEWFQHPVIAEVFLTPKGSQGSPLHSDAHDVFVLQVSGSKRWRVYGMPEGDPSQPLEGRVGPLLFERILRPGDMLYVPWRQPHEALTEPDQSSFHVSIGEFPFLWRDLMIHRLRCAMDRDPRFDEPLPAAFLTRPLEEIQSRLDELWVSATEGADTQDAVDQLGVEFCQKLRPVANDQFAQVDQLPSLTINSRLQRRGGMICHLQRNGTTAKLAFPGTVLEVPYAALPAVEAITSAAGSFAPAGLPGNLDDEGRLTLVRSLFKAGLLQFSASTTFEPLIHTEAYQEPVMQT